MDEELPGRWVDDPPLPALKPPPPDLIQVHGARLVHVLQIDDPDPRRQEGYTPVLFMAWAAIPGSRDWAVLAAWLGTRQEALRTTGRGRWGWLRLTPDDLERGRVRAHTPYREPEDEWWGQHPLSEFTKAGRAAAATLPEHLREKALQPRQLDVDTPS